MSKSDFAGVDVFVLPDSWAFYQATLGFDAGIVEVAGEPHGSVAVPTITLHMELKKESATLFLTADEASEIWTALGHAIHTASGKDPVKVELIRDDPA